MRAAALAAAALAFASAAVSLYWTAGGTALLDTVGGEIEELARERSAAAVAAGALVVALKALSGIAAMRLAAGSRSRPLLAANALAAAVLILWGGANVLAGGLVLAGAIDGPAGADLRALRWHVALWDLWFLVWGLALAAAVRTARPRR